MNVELGAGASVAEDFLAVDLNRKHADVIADALRLPFATGSVRNLRAVDVLEHLSYRDTDMALAEWRRICRDNASVFVQVPDAETIMRWFVTDDPRLHRADQPCDALYGAQWRLLGGHDDLLATGGDWRWNAHYSLWSESLLGQRMWKAGFRVVRVIRNEHPNLLCSAVAA